MAADDRRVLAAHLRDARARPCALRELADHLHADLVGAGERHAGDPRVVDQRRAHLATRARYVVDHARRQAGVAQHLEQQPAAPGRVGRRLEDHRVARHQGGADRPARQREREVERCDHRPRAIGLQHGAVAADEAGQRVIRQCAIETLVGLHLVAVPAEQVGGFLHLANGLHAVLADFERHRRADVVDALLDQRCDPSQQAHALAPWRGRPGSLRVHRRRHGVSGVLRRAARKAAEEPAAVDRRAGLEICPSVARRSVDPLWIVPPELTAHAGERRVEPLVQLCRRIEHRRVGQPKRRVAHFSLAPLRVDTTGGTCPAAAVTAG